MRRSRALVFYISLIKKKMKKLFKSPQEACDALNVILDKPVPPPGGHLRLMHKNSRTHDRSVYLNVYTENFGCVYCFRTKQKVFWNSENNDLSSFHQTQLIESRKSNYELMKRLLRVATRIKAHLYLEKKCLRAYANYPLYELRRKYVEKLYSVSFMKNFQGERFILVPMQDKHGRFQTAQLINENGDKRFLRGSTKNYFFSIGDLKNAEVIGIAEGVATALSVSQIEVFPVVAAMSCSQFCNVVPIIKATYPKAKLIVLSDIGNGEQEARKVAFENSVHFVVPHFSKEEIEEFEQLTNNKPTDFNDYFILRGDLP